MVGSVKRRSGGWAFRVDVGASPATGRRCQVSKQGFATKRAAAQAMAEVVRVRRPPAPRSAPSTWSLGEYLEQWVTGEAARVSPATLRTYRLAVGRVVAMLGDLGLSRLSGTDVAAWQQHLLHPDDGGRGLSPATVRNTRAVFHKALSDAVRVELLDRNPVAATDPPANVAHRTTGVWTAEQLRGFLDQVSTHRLSLAFRLLATTGMRRGELLGLRWGDVDWDRGAVSVVRSLGLVDGELVMSPGKTATSRRLVFLDSITLGHLRADFQRAIEAAAAGDSDPVITPRRGGPLHPDSFSNTFDRLVATAGVPRVRLHDLRHTYATLALHAGMHPVVLAERLGHSSVATTMDLYAHVIPAISRDGADIVANTLFAPRP
ncbi:MAG: site-specific integrase [Actinobacteria bacterium]|nr:site-specific integrase [Actinomycetota bacterium]